jgi:hypothetical protein
MTSDSIKYYCKSRATSVCANVSRNGASLYASWAENGGWNYGGGYRFEAWRYENLAEN